MARVGGHGDVVATVVLQQGPPHTTLCLHLPPSAHPPSLAVAATPRVLFPATHIADAAGVPASQPGSEELALGP